MFVPYSQSENTHLDNIIKSLAHEVRNPLANINLSIEFLEPAISEDLQLYTSIIRRNSLRINDLIKDLIDSRTRVLKNNECLSIQKVLKEALAIVNDRIILKNILVDLHFGEDYMIKSDHAKLKIAFTNIIINAIEAMTAVNGVLVIKTIIKKNSYLVEIEDNGCGMSSSEIATIFTPYVSGKINGLGIGLSITDQILKECNIGLIVKSKPKVGTRFVLKFPYEAALISV